MVKRMLTSTRFSISLKSYVARARETPRCVSTLTINAAIIVIASTFIHIWKVGSCELRMLLFFGTTIGFPISMLNTVIGQKPQLEMKIHDLWCLPEHTTPVPWYPATHWQVKLPSVLMHRAFTLQLSKFLVHSLISKINMPHNSDELKNGYKDPA